MKLPHQVLGAAFGRVRAPGARTAAPKVKNCRTGATMILTITAVCKLVHLLCCDPLTSQTACSFCLSNALVGSVAVLWDWENLIHYG